MPSYPIGERPMSSAERSARNLLQQRQEMADIRTTLVESIELLLKHGNLLVQDGHRDEAFDAFRLAEVQYNHIQVINGRLAYHEDKIKSVRLPPRKGFPIPKDPRKDLILTSEKKPTKPIPPEEHESLEQLAYKEKRAQLRPITDAKFGHLARAPKPEEVE